MWKQFNSHSRGADASTPACWSAQTLFVGRPYDGDYMEEQDDDGEDINNNDGEEMEVDDYEREDL